MSGQIVGVAPLPVVTNRDRRRLAPALPGPIPKASASRRGLPRIRSTSCPGIVFRPREPGISPVAWRGIHPPVIPPSPACSFLQFFHRRTPGECLVSWRLRARRHGSGILFRWFGDGELCGRVLPIATDGAVTRPTAILAMSGASVNARTRTRRGWKNEHPCSVPGVAPRHAAFGCGLASAAKARRRAAATRRTCFVCAVLRTSSTRAREPSAAFIPASGIASAVAAPALAGLGLVFSPTIAAPTASNHRSEQNRDGNDAYVASEAGGQTKATELGMNISSQG